MSGHGSLLPIPDDPRFQAITDAWPSAWSNRAYPRAAWLATFEAALRLYYPQASSRDLSLTARHAAPFWLKDGPDVP